MARSGVADKVTMVTRGDMEWPGKGARDMHMTTCHKKRTFKGLISCEQGGAGLGIPYWYPVS